MLNPKELLDEYFVETRNRLLEVAAFLDRLERADPAHAHRDFRGTALRMRIPLVCLITYRGYAKMIKNFGGVPAAVDAQMLSRSEVDSTAPMTEPTLRAWGLPFELVHGEGDLPTIIAAFGRARALEAPVAVLITGDTT